VPKGAGEWLIERCCRRQEELREVTLVFDVAAAGAVVVAAVAAAVVEGAVHVVAGGGGAGDAVPVVAVAVAAVVVAAVVVVVVVAAPFAGLGEVGVVEVVMKGDHVVGVASSQRDDIDPLRGHGRVERVPPGIDTFLRDLLATSNNAWRVNTSL
jgi:hypothetical protein